MRDSIGLLPTCWKCLSVARLRLYCTEIMVRSQRLSNRLQLSAEANQVISFRRAKKIEPAASPKRKIMAIGLAARWGWSRMEITFRGGQVGKVHFFQQVLQGEP